MMRILDWRFDPMTVLEQSDELMGDLLQISSTYDTIKRMLKAKRVV